MTRALGIASALLVLVGALLALGCGGGATRYRAGSVDLATRSSSGDTMSRRTEVAESGGSAGYGEAEYAYDSDDSYEDQISADVAVVDIRAEERAPTTTTTSTGSGASMDVSGAAISEPLAGPSQPPADLYAQAQTSTTTPEATATDAVDTSGELLIYTALFHVGVYDVAASQASIAESARSVGGFIFQQTDDRIIVRVPAPRFRAFVETVEGVGDVLHRQIDAQDVGEEFRDVEIRIRNLEAVRDRIAALLERGLSVEQVLVVERELERVTSELERMRGRQRYLADHIAFSTVTVLFRPAPREAIDQPDVFQLPFSWLDSLGLSNLLNLR